MRHSMTALMVAFALILASGGCGLLDSVNRLPGTIGGKSTPAPGVDYSKPENMAGALDQLRTALKGDDAVVRVTMGNDQAEVFTLTQGVALVGGVVSPTTFPFDAVSNKGLPLADFDPAATMQRISRSAQERGCTEPTRVAITVAANQKLISDVTCLLNGDQVQLVEGPDGDVLAELDLTTRDGISKAVSDVLAVNPSDARYTVFGFQYDTASGIPYLQTVTGRTQTSRLSKIDPYMPALFQSNTGVDSKAKDFAITGITPQTFATVYDAAKKKCGEVALLALVLATNGEPVFQSGSFSCPYQADRTGRPV